MTIEIHNAELENLLEQRLKSGEVADVEELLLDTLRREAASTTRERNTADSLVAFFRKSPLVGLELDLHRDQDDDRDIRL